ncbi:MAG: FitA-like ribbon-helix-helix domain-containing protein [Jatrophihabitans sp.]
MSSEIIQVRDVPTQDVEALRTRAATRNMSLSSYLRELIHDDTSRPAMSDVLAQIAARDRVEASGDDVRSFIEDDRKE